MRCVSTQGTRDTFDLQMQIIMGDRDEGLDDADVQESAIREIAPLDFESPFKQPNLVFHDDPSHGGAPFTLEMPTYSVEEAVDELNFKKHDMMITDDIVYTRSQAKKLRKQGFVIPSYRVLAGKSERIARMGHGTGTAHGDRAVVAINSEMMQQRWTKWRDNNGTFIVPYYFAKNFPGHKEDQGTINSHIKWFNKELNQCLRLEEVNSYDMRYDSKIRIIDGNGCWSYIGMTGEDTQDLSLGSFCYTKGLSLHEFIHALGFDHEQNRPDRDQYVSMHWDKIREDKKWNFQIMSNAEWNPTGHHYDFQSVMHYSSKNFAKNGIGPTMTRRVAGRDTGEEIIAQRDRPSTIDMQQICAIYGCAENCGHELKHCANGQKVFKHRFCDGIIDCADESDESNCSWGCCAKFSININDREYVYEKAGQWKGKDYFYSAADKKYLFFYHNYWGFSEVLGQPTFYYYAKAEAQCPDNVSFLYYSWKVAGSATARLKCMAKENQQKPESSPESGNSIDGDKSVAATTKAPATTTTPHKKCERTDLKPVEGGEWKCAGSVCRASCTAPGFAPECTQSAKLTCLSGSGWNFPTTLCKCKVPDKQCPELNVLKGAATRKGAAMACDNDTSVGSTCRIQCPQKNEQAYCKSSKGSRTFECKSSGDWSSNKRNDCDCRSACQSPEEQFSHISSEILPRFDSCESTTKNAMCRAKCPDNTYTRARNGPASVMATKCACKGTSCLWAVGKKPVSDLFCIKRDMCEHPKHYLSKISTAMGNSIVCDTDAQHGGFFFQAGTTCRFNCSKVTAKVANGMTCQCDGDGYCNWFTDMAKKPKLLKGTQALKCG